MNTAQKNLCLLFFAALFLIAPPLPGYTQSNVPPQNAKVGVLAFRGEDVAVSQWATLIHYLGASIDGWEFTLVPVTLVSAPEKINAQEIDFLITNPGHYVTLSQQHELSVLATRERRVNGMGLLRYGTVIFSRSNSGIQSLDDLKGKRLAAVSPDAFGGFQLAWSEFQKQEIYPFEDLETIRFMGFPQDAIVMSVLSGDIEAGVVRSGLLENLMAENIIEIDDFKVLQDNSQLGYPYKVSGALYPEWPFTALSGIDKQLREKVALALLATQNEDIAHAYSLGDIWSAPLSYENVRVLVNAYNDRDASRSSGLLVRENLLTFVAFGLFLVAATFAFIRRRPIAIDPRVTNAEPPEKETELSQQELEDFTSLTKREREVLALICNGQSSKSIADELGISPKTVEYHRSNLLQKTHAKSSTNLVQLATRLEHDLGFSLGEFAKKQM